MDWISVDRSSINEIFTCSSDCTITSTNGGVIHCHGWYPLGVGVGTTKWILFNVKAAEHLENDRLILFLQKVFFFFIQKKRLYCNITWNMGGWETFSVLLFKTVSHSVNVWCFLKVIKVPLEVLWKEVRIIWKCILQKNRTTRNGSFSFFNLNLSRIFQLCFNF